MQGRRTLDTDAPFSVSDCNAHRAKHALGVVTRNGRLHDGGVAARVKTSEQDRRFHLRAGHRHHVVNAFEIRIARDLERRLAVPAADVRTHPAQRRDDALHRPCGQRFVAGQRRCKILSCQHSGHEAHGGPRVAQIEIDTGRLEPLKPDTVDHEFRGSRALYRDAHAAKGTHGSETVLTRQESTNLGNTFGDAAKHDRAMRYRFVAGHPDICIADCRWMDQVMHREKRP